MINCPKCDTEMHEKQPMCYNCGYSKKYLKSNSPLAKYFNAQILLFKGLGFKKGLIYLIASPINLVFSKIPWIIRNNIEFLRLKIEGKELQPPWVEYPEIEWGSIGWRMGYGESYLMKWDHWYNKLANEDRSNYQNRFPQPEEWKGFYSSRDK